MAGGQRLRAGALGTINFFYYFCIVFIKNYDMTISQLQYVLAVDRHRHFAKAAADANVTQPTLSMQIQKLEEELGILLFDRSKHPVRPTAIGDRVIEQARRAVQEIQRIDEILQVSKNNVEGTFKLGIIPTVLPSLVPRFLADFRAQLPAVDLQIVELPTDHILDMLRRDELDAAILATPLEERSIIERPLYYEPFMAFIPPNHRLGAETFVTNSELDIDDILLLDEGHCFRNSIINLCNSHPRQSRLGISLESGSFEVLLRLARQGQGMTLLPYLHARELPESDQSLIKPIAEPTPTREISLVYSRAELKIKVIDELAAVIQKAVPAKLLKEKNKILSPVQQVG